MKDITLLCSCHHHPSPEHFLSCKTETSLCSLWRPCTFKLRPPTPLCVTTCLASNHYFCRNSHVLFAFLRSHNQSLVRPCGLWTLMGSDGASCFQESCSYHYKSLSAKSPANSHPEFWFLFESVEPRFWNQWELPEMSPSPRHRSSGSLGCFCPHGISGTQGSPNWDFVPRGSHSPQGMRDMLPTCISKTF